MSLEEILLSFGRILFPYRKILWNWPQHSSRERLSRMTMNTYFDQLKYQLLELGVPRLSLASKSAILNKAAEFARSLGQTDLALTNERKRLAKKNADLRQMLESDKMEYFKTQNKEFEYIIYEI